MATCVMRGRCVVDPNKIATIEPDKPAEPGLVGPVERAVLSRPRAEALYEPHRIEGMAAEMAKTEITAGLQNALVNGALVIRLTPDLESELAGEAHPPDEAADQTHLDLSQAEEWKRRLRDVDAYEWRQHVAQLRPGDRQAHLLADH